MRPKGGLRFWALLVAALLAVPIVAASLNTASPTDSLNVGDQLSAWLVQPFADAASFGDSLSAYLAPTYTDAMSFGDSLSASLFQPFADVASFGDSLFAYLVPSYTDAMNFGDSLLAQLVQPFADAVSFGDAVVTMLVQPYTDGLGVGDSILAQLMQPFTDSLAIGDKLSTLLVSAITTTLGDALQIGDQLSTGLLSPFNDVLDITEAISTVRLSISGAAGTQVTTDSSGNTIITGTDKSGDVITRVSLPPGTTMGASAAVSYQVQGNDSVTQVSGFTVPYPPGKVVTILNGPGVSSVCIVDSPTGATLQAQVCGATSLSSSHVILPCDSSPHTYGPFPSGPSSRTYTCSPTTIGGLKYLQVSGLAFSTTIVDGARPTLTLPSDITKILTGRSGATATFPVSASDPLDPDPAVACSAQSGAIFPIGTTTVTCTATDAAGNVAKGSFTISVVYDFGGFLPPLQSGAAYHIGDIIPVEFHLTDAAGNQVPFAVAKITAGTVAGTFRYDYDHYEFDLDTRGMQPGPLTITVSLDDGTTHSITIDLTNSYPTTLSLNCFPSVVFVGEVTHCDATVDPQGGPKPTGAVVFTSGYGQGNFSRVTCDAGDYQGSDGQNGDQLNCAVDYSSSSPGNQTITANYPGDSHDLPSTGSFKLTVTLIPTTTFLNCDPSRVQAGKTTQCEADVTSQDGSLPTGSVTFTSSDSKGTFGQVRCTTNRNGGYGGGQGGVLTCQVDYAPSSSGGKTTITATYPGDPTHSSSTGTFTLNADNEGVGAPAPGQASIARAILPRLGDAIWGTLAKPLNHLSRPL